jgi:hypothetical protein
MNLLRKCLSRARLSLPVFAALLVSMPAQATLQQITAPALGGTTASAVFDTSTNLQWLTPQVTRGLSFAGVAGIGYFALGYRYATSDELIALLGASGYDTSPLLADPTVGHWAVSESDTSAINNLISMLGATASTTIIYGMLADIKPSASDPARGHALATLSGPYVLVLGPAFPTSDYDTGSFLVRELAPVPEPGTAALFAVGLLLVAPKGLTRMRSLRGSGPESSVT